MASQGIVEDKNYCDVAGYSFGERKYYNNILWCCGMCSVGENIYWQDSTQDFCCATPAEVAASGCFWGKEIEVSSVWNPVHINCQDRIVYHHNNKQTVVFGKHQFVEDVTWTNHSDKAQSNRAGFGNIKLVEINHGPVVDIWTDGFITVDGVRITSSHKFSSELPSYPAGKYNLKQFLTSHQHELEKHFKDKHGDKLPDVDLDGVKVPTHNHSCLAKEFYYNWGWLKF